MKAKPNPTKGALPATQPSPVTREARAPRPFVPMPWHAHAATALAMHRIVVLVGEPGTGKTAYVQDNCRSSTQQPAEEVQGTPKLDDPTFWGRYILAGDATPFVDGPLTRALKRGSYLVLNDVGQVPYAVLSTLLPLRHADQLVNPISQEVIEVPESFRLVLTTNREGASCRSNLSAMTSLLDGSLVVDVPEPNETEIRTILAAHRSELRAKELDRLLAIRTRFTNLANKDGERQKVVIGLRAMLQLATLLRAGLPENEAISQAIVGKFLLHKDKYDAAQLTNQLG